jgi:hypothetical protein
MVGRSVHTAAWTIKMAAKARAGAAVIQARGETGGDAGIRLAIHKAASSCE